MHVLASWQDLAAQQKYTQILSKNPTKIFRFITASNKTCRFCWCLPKKVFAALRSWAPRLSANSDLPSPFSWQIQFLLGCYFKDEVSFIKYLHVVYNKFPVWHPAPSIKPHNLDYNRIGSSDPSSMVQVLPRGIWVTDRITTRTCTMKTWERKQQKHRSWNKPPKQFLGPKLTIVITKYIYVIRYIIHVAGYQATKRLVTWATNSYKFGSNTFLAEKLSERHLWSMSKSNPSSLTTPIQRKLGQTFWYVCYLQSLKKIKQKHICSTIIYQNPSTSTSI